MKFIKCPVDKSSINLSSVRRADQTCYQYLFLVSIKDIWPHSESITFQSHLKLYGFTLKSSQLYAQTWYGNIHHNFPSGCSKQVHLTTPIYSLTIHLLEQTHNIKPAKQERTAVLTKVYKSILYITFISI